MTKAQQKQIKAHLRRLSAKRFRDLHDTIHDDAMLRKAAEEENRSWADALALRQLILDEHTRRHERDPLGLGSLLEFDR